MESKNCIVCDKLFTKKSESSTYWSKRKYCSQKCAGIAWIGQPAPKSAFKKGHKTWNKGRHIKTNNCLEKWRKENNGGKADKHPRWKGEKAKYAAIHMWVGSNKKKPKNCTGCGKKGNSYQIHWSNIDHKYRRNLDDYIALCTSCHKQYDLDNNLSKH